MAQPTYIPTVKEQARLAGALRAEKVARLAINAGNPGDGEVEVVLEHSPDYKISPCVDRYLVQVGGDGGFVIKKQFCANVSPPQAPEIVEPADKGRWFALHPLFIPDTTAVQENPLWNDALQIEISWELANPRFDVLRRLLARPPSDFLKKVREQTTPEVLPAAWKSWEETQAFFQLTRPMEGRLTGLVNQEKTAPSVQQHIASFTATVTDPKLKASDQDLSLFLKLAFPEEWLAKIQKKVRAVLFSEYLFLPEDRLDQATNKLSDWVCRRILWEAAFAQTKSKAKLDAAKKLDPAQTEFFQTKLETLFLDPAVGAKDVEDLVTAFQITVWELQKEMLESKNLFSSKAVSDWVQQVRSRFDEEIGFPAIRKLLDKSPKLSEDNKKIVEGRIKAVFQEGKPPLRWELLNAANFREPEALLATIKVEGEQEITASMNYSAGAAITASLPGSYQTNQLTAEGASQLVFDLKKLQGEGKPRMETGKILKDQILHLEPDMAKAYLKGILALDEEEDVELETQARHLLEIAILEDFAEKSIWSSPWLWTAIGVGTGALAGAAVFLSGAEEGGARPGPAANGGGNGNNGNGNGNGPGPTPIPDDGRGTPTTVGP